MTYASEKCHKIILLTATPFVNNLYDIENLIAMIENRQPNEESYFYQQCIGKSVYVYFKYKISHYEKSQDNEDFPERREGFMRYDELIKNKAYDKVDYKNMTNEIINAYSNLGVLFMDDETSEITNSLNNQLSKKSEHIIAGIKRFQITRQHMNEK